MLRCSVWCQGSGHRPVRTKQKKIGNAGESIKKAWEFTKQKFT